MEENLNSKPTGKALVANDALFALRPSKRLFRWLALNLSVVAIIVLGVEHGSGIACLGIMLLWLSLPLHILALCIPEELAKSGQSAPCWLKVSLGVFLALFLAHRGYVASGIIAILSCIMEQIAYNVALSKANSLLSDKSVAISPK